jgi:F-type H+-transporting ATPase subunit epsilon
VNVPEGKIHLSVVTPERKLIEENVDEIVLPGGEGYLGVLPGHAPLLTSLKVGELTYKLGGRTLSCFIAWGFAEILPDRVSVLADIGERPEDVDLQRAKAARERAEQRLKGGAADTDFERAKIALEKALIRMQVAAKR